MQDRFKFRFWNGRGIIYDDLPHLELYNCEDYIWMQCTGLKDNNGKLIYEGDILRYPPQNKDEEKNYVACEVFFHNNDCCDNHIGFQMNRYRFQGSLCGIANYGTKYKFIPKNTERMEVIGNIYENPELLGGGNEQL